MEAPPILLLLLVIAGGVVVLIQLVVSPLLIPLRRFDDVGSTAMSLLQMLTRKGGEWFSIRRGRYGVS